MTSLRFQAPEVYEKQQEKNIKKKKIKEPVTPSQDELMCNKSLRAFSSLDS